MSPVAGFIITDEVVSLSVRTLSPLIHMVVRDLTPLNWVSLTMVRSARTDVEKPAARMHGRNVSYCGSLCHDSTESAMCLWS